MEKSSKKDTKTQVDLLGTSFQTTRKKEAKDDDENEDEDEEEEDEDENENRDKYENEEEKQEKKNLDLETHSQEEKKVNEISEKQKEKQKRKRKEEKGTRILIIGAILVVALVFSYTLVGLALWAGVRLLNVSNQVSEPIQYKTSDRTLAVSLLVFAPLSLFFLTFGIVWVLVSWRKRKMAEHPIRKKKQKKAKNLFSKETKQTTKNGTTTKSKRSKEKTATATETVETDSEPSDDDESEDELSELEKELKKEM